MISSYWLVNQLWYFFEDESDDLAAILEAQAQWIKEHPEASLVAARARMGWDGESQTPFVEGEIEYCVL